MANKLQILSNGDTFDLFEGEAERFYITYQIHDLSNLQTRNGDFSRRVSLPLTARNKDILGAATAFDWTPTGITSKTDTTSDVVIPDAQWVTNQSERLLPSSSPNVAEMNEAGFFIYCHSVLTKIFAGFTGLTFDTSAMDAQFSKYAVACAMPLLHDQYTNGETITTTINPQDYFPDISQRDFVREIFKLQNIVAVEANNVVTLKYFKGLETATSQNLVLNTDNTKTIYNTFKTYSQTNELKYSDDDIVEGTDFDSSFLVNSETLPLSGTIIQSKFFPCDLGEALVPNVRSTAAAWDVEYFKSAVNFSPSSGTLNFTTNHPFEGNVGDIVTSIGRIVTLDATKESGTVSTNFTSSTSVNIPPYYRYKANGRTMQVVSIEDASLYNMHYNGVVFSSNQPAKRAEFTTAMKWDNLKTEYYQLLVDSMEKPFIVKAWINIPTISLLTLNPLAPVYVEDYNAYFYINKLEQWRLNTSARVELIEIPI
mgnify:CR=1 FL=1